MTAPIEIILATAAHEAGFMALQAANLVANIPMAHHASGFVTTPFTSEQYATLVNERYLMVAMAEDQLIGYVVSASWDFLQHYPIFAYMIELLPSLSLDGVMMSEHHSYQYGPVCIDAAWRGKNLLPHMFDEAKTHMSSRYPYSLTFVNSRNHRSREAHIRKLGLQHLRDFSLGNSINCVIF